DWLLGLRPATAVWFTGAADAVEDDPARGEKRQERERHYADFRARLLTAAADRKDDSRRRLADLLGFHAREDKPQWWEFFDRRDRFEEEWLDDGECLAGLERVGEPTPVKRSL